MIAERLIFLPGAGGSREFWQPVADLLPHPGEKILLGWPGFGSTPADPEIRSLEDLYRSLMALIDRPADLIAQSMGCVLALRAVLDARERVRRLVLTAVSGGLDMSRFGAMDWREDARRADSGEPDWFANDRSDFTARLGEIQAPVLLLASDADPISPLAVAQYLAAMLPRADLVVIPGGGHWLAREHPDAVAAHIARHLGPAGRPLSQAPARAASDDGPAA